jgi:hypothetical protein
MSGDPAESIYNDAPSGCTKQSENAAHLYNEERRGNSEGRAKPQRRTRTGFGNLASNSSLNLAST